MVFKPSVVQERLKALNEAVTRLKDLKKLSLVSLTKNYRNTWAAERGL